MDSFKWRRRRRWRPTSLIYLLALVAVRAVAPTVAGGSGRTELLRLGVIKSGNLQESDVRGGTAAARTASRLDVIRGKRETEAAVASIHDPNWTTTKQVHSNQDSAEDQQQQEEDEIRSKPVAPPGASNYTTSAAPPTGSLAKQRLLKTAKPSMLNSAVINGNASLHCDITPAGQDDSVALVLWYKDDSLAPIYTVDARRANSLELARTSLDEAYAARAHFNTRARPAQLELSQVRAEDEGEYRCRVDFRRGRTVNTIIALRVVLPPEEVRIVAPLAQGPLAAKHRLEGLVGPLNEGDPLTLLCLARGGKPRPQLQWRRDYNLLDESHQRLDKEGASNELKIPALTRAHMVSGFTCQASNTNLTEPLSASIQLDLNLKPEEVSLRQVGGAQELVAGNSATFECLSHGSKPQATLHWLFQSRRHDTPMNVDQQQTSSRFTLNLQRQFNQQNLTCVAENPRMAASSAKSQTIKLDVHYPPQLEIKLERPPQPGDPLQAQFQLQEGNDIYLSCPMEANPRPSKPILWRHNQRHLTPTSMLVMNNQSLVLRKVHRNQSGSYTCEASNQHGSGSSGVLELNIRHAPVCATDDILVVEAATGKKFELECQVEANPSKSVHFSWFVARQTEPSANLSAWFQRDASLDEQLDESAKLLKLRLPTPKADNNDEAEQHLLVKCKAKNEIGLQQRPCLFRVVPAKRPQLRHLCVLVKLSSSSSLQVSCEEQLKSDEAELQNGGGVRNENDKPQDPWNFLENIRQAHLASAGDTQGDQNGSSQQQPRLRHEQPLTWILVEVYATGKGAEDELVGYVVAARQSQLNRIKRLVEESRLLASNPRKVYYVPTRPPPQTEDEERPELGAKFSFQVNNLEPQSRYKLQVYAQNLANRSSEWQTLQAETIATETKPAGGQQEETNAGQDHSAPASKSIVMRSDQREKDHLSALTLLEKLQGEQQPPSDERLPSDNQTEGARLQQLAALRDQALQYAKQKPLLAVPMLVTALILILIVVAWTGSQVVQLAGCGSSGRRRGSARRPASSNRRRSSSSTEDSCLHQKQTTNNGPNNKEELVKALNAAGKLEAASYLQEQQQEENLREYLEQQQQHHQQQQAVYAIGGNQNSTIYGHCSPFANDYGSLEQNQAAFVGSLERSHQRQPIYLGACNEALDGFVAASLGRRSSMGNFSFGRAQQQPLVVTAAELGQLEQEGYQLQAASHHQQATTTTTLNNGLLLSELANSCSYNSGSFSSTECSLEMLQHQFQLQQQQQLKAPRSRHSRVAFDLSNQPKDKRDHNGNTVAAAGKGSDSSGSNSGAAADSGHESPAAAELAAHYQRRLLASSSPTPANKLVMLMELSPGSQEESAASLLDSFVSAGDHIRCPHQQRGLCCVGGQPSADEQQLQQREDSNWL